MKFSLKQAFLIAMLPVNAIIAGLGIVEYVDNKENADKIENKLAADFAALEQDEAFLQKRDIAQKIEVVENEETGVRQFFMDGEKLDLDNEEDQAKVDAYYEVQAVHDGLQDQVSQLKAADSKTVYDGVLSGGMLLTLYTATGLSMVQNQRKDQKGGSVPKKTVTHGI